jgi:hypothetical protein
MKDNRSFDFQSIISFYTAPELPLHKIKYSSRSLLHQIQYPTPPQPNQDTSNRFSAFFEDSEMTSSQMEVENHPEQHRDPPDTPPPTLKPAWTNDTTVSTLSDDIFQWLQKHQQHIQDAGELEEHSPTYEKPDLLHSQTRPTHPFQFYTSLGHSLRYPNSKTFQVFCGYSMQC